MKTFANHTDEELALLYIAGDNKAFDELLARNQQKLFNYIFFVVGDYEVTSSRIPLSRSSSNYRKASTQTLGNSSSG